MVEWWCVVAKMQFIDLELSCYIQNYQVILLYRVGQK